MRVKTPPPPSPPPLFFLFLFLIQRPLSVFLSPGLLSISLLAILHQSITMQTPPMVAAWIWQTSADRKITTPQESIPFMPVQIKMSPATKCLLA